MSDMKPTMTLISSNWHGMPCFRLIPITEDAPYTEGLYDPASKVLVLMLKYTKESVHLLPKLDDAGDPVRAKKPRSNGKAYKEQRVKMNTFPEFYIEKKEEIEEILTKLTDNHETFDYATYLNAPSAEEQAKMAAEALEKSKTEGPKIEVVDTPEAEA